ncbi:MAG: Uroporphyrinogen decarboxylase [Alphaproteobacteria bacterium MarineAlpha3_Bin5]|nr:MAG: Uroporphyrinogen decarboxylase [Alphaproteobacteria bacterium MarineAlpha3_Bin5]
MEKKLTEVLNKKIIKPPPIWFMRQAGRYLPEYRKLRKSCSNFLDFCYSPELAIKATLQPMKRYDLDAAILFSDILIIPDALGQKVWFKEGEGPILDPIKSHSDLKILSSNCFRERIDPILRTVSGVKKELPKNKAFIGFCGAPWTVAVYMVEGKGKTDCSRILKWASKDPESFAKLIGIVTDNSIRYLLHQIRCGVDVIQIFDSWSGLLNAEQFQQWVILPTKKIIAEIRKKYTNFPFIGFPRLAGPNVLDYIIETKVTGVSIDDTVSLHWAAKVLQTKSVIQGNLSNKLLLEGGQPMKIAANNILNNLHNGPFIFNLGHGVLPGTPVKNVEKLIEYIKNWKGYYS